MRRKFWKMQGIGNDYLYFDCFSRTLSNPSDCAVKLSDRHFSVGGDGIILVEKSEIADAKMRMFNADGSEGKMCGNGIRCVGRFLYDVKNIKKDVLTVETLSGVKTLKIHTQGGKFVSVSVDMGAPVFQPKDIPAGFEGEQAIGVSLQVMGKEYRVTALSMGNPHCVVFGADPDSIPLETLGSAFETHPMFPARVNTEFVQVLGKNELKMRVWERGSGETLACGTGACAAAVAAVLHGDCERHEDILVRLRGGNLVINYGETITLTGPAEFSFCGTAEI